MLFRSKSKLSILFTIIAIVCIVIMFLLGFWQLERKYQKEARLAQIEARQDLNALNLNEVLDAPENYVDFPVVLTGELENKTFFIDNKLKNGMSGYEVLAPVFSDYGAVMLNLGWVPGTTLRSELPKILLPTGDTFEGRLYIPQDNVMISETNFNYGRFPARLQQVDFNEIEKHLGTAVLPFTLRLAASADNNFVRDWQAVVMPPERHLGYAIQWFGLGIAGLTVFLLTVLKSMQGHKE